MILTKIYVGSNNETGILELVIIHKVLQSLGICGYTLTQGAGYWQGKSENTAIIEILGDYNTGIIPELKRELKQDSILVITSIVNAKFND